MKLEGLSEFGHSMGGLGVIRKRLLGHMAREAENYPGPNWSKGLYLGSPITAPRHWLKHAAIYSLSS